MTVDARGLSCPMPVVKAQKAMKELPAGAVLEVLATDRGSKADMPAWCRAQNYTLLHAGEDGGEFRYYIRKGS